MSAPQQLHFSAELVWQESWAEPNLSGSSGCVFTATKVKVSACRQLNKCHCWFTMKMKHKEHCWMGQTQQFHATQWPSTLKTFCSVQAFTLLLLHGNIRTCRPHMYMLFSQRGLRQVEHATAAAGSLTAKHKNKKESLTIVQSSASCWSHNATSLFLPGWTAVV